MGAMVVTAWSALRLDAAALRRWSATQGALAWGLALLALASLLGGLAGGAAAAGACLHRPPPGPAEQRAVADLAGWLSRTPLAPDAQHELVRTVAAALELRGNLAGLPRPLGHEAGCALQGLQLATTAPYRRLALWLPYTLAVCAAARALGGRAGPAQMLAATSLYALPHLLDPLLAVPGLEGLARPVLFLWGAAIYLRAWAAASRLGGPRALLAVALPGLAAVTVVMVVMAIVALVWGLRN